jgi:thiamine-phosphate pyrophosphorylase
MTASPAPTDPDRPRLPRGLYLVTPDDADTERLLARVEVLLDAAACLQYRNKAADAELRRQQALGLAALCRARGLPFIVNDDVALAACVDADGVHLGEDDGDVAHARERLGPQAIIGASCYDDLARAARAAAAGADYLAFGACYPSTTKPHARRATPAVFAEAARFGLPRVAIGGIHAGNAAPLLAVGVELLAVIGGVFDAVDPPAEARRLQHAIVSTR